MHNIKHFLDNGSDMENSSDAITSSSVALSIGCIQKHPIDTPCSFEHWALAPGSNYVHGDSASQVLESPRDSTLSSQFPMYRQPPVAHNISDNEQRVRSLCPNDNVQTLTPTFLQSRCVCEYCREDSNLKIRVIYSADGNK